MYRRILLASALAGTLALGLAVSELDNPPKWAVIRNMSDPTINGDLLAWLSARRVRNTTEAAHSVPRRLTDSWASSTDPCK